MGRAPCCDKSRVKKGPWSPEEDTTLKNYIHKHGTGGNWIALPTKAASQLPGRTDNDIKNYWNTKLKKKLLATNNMNLATRDTVDTNLSQFSDSIPKTETLQDQGAPSCFDGTLPYLMDVSSGQSFDPCTQISPSNPMEVNGFETREGKSFSIISPSQEVSSLPTSSGLGLENNYSIWSGNECVDNVSGVLMDYGFEPPNDDLLDGFGY
ncbi:hypothetical protein DVH24_029400 [Malus domestica]|uniref:Uncharacterized protein n=1 Tax=Malus domestica TaxID=3750 RepID=A0A498HVJ0_MALDO|nr:hypothetical protein DVH24_029400 [Malus domestica]